MPSLCFATAATYASHIEMCIRPLLGHRIAKDLTHQHIEAFAASLREPLVWDFLQIKAERRAETSGGTASDWVKRMSGKPTGASTLSAVLTQLTMVLNYAVESNWIRANPAEHVSKKQTRVRRVDQEKVLSKAEVRRLIEATGMRKSELAGLQWGDVDFSANLVQVRRQCYKKKFTSPKSEHGVREIPLAPELAHVLKAWKLACPITDLKLVFPSDRGKPVSGKLIDKYVLHPARAANLRPID